MALEGICQTIHFLLMALGKGDIGIGTDFKASYALGAGPGGRVMIIPCLESLIKY